MTLGFKFCSFLSRVFHPSNLVKVGDEPKFEALEPWVRWNQLKNPSVGKWNVSLFGIFMAMDGLLLRGYVSFLKDLNGCIYFSIILWIYIIPPTQ